MKSVSTMMVLLILVTSKPAGAQDDKKWKLDVQLYRTNSINLLTDMVEDEMTSEGGASTDIGIGAKLRAGTHVSLKGGLHMWGKIMKPSYEARIDGNTRVQVYESLKLKYTGLYLQAIFENETLFGGVGVDAALSSKYTSHYTVSGSVAGGGAGKSPLDEYFQDPVDLVFLAGFALRMSPNVVIKPTIQAALPMIPTVDFGVTAQGPVGEEKALINVLLIKFGINAEIGF